MPIREMLRFLSKMLIRLGLHLFWLFPVRRGRVTLLNELSFSFGDNLKYFYEYLRKTPEDPEIFFPVRDPSTLPKNEKLLTALPMSFKYFFL